VQDEITAKIIEAMDIKLVTGEMAPTIRKIMRDLDALLILAGANAALDRQEEASGAAYEVLRIKPDFTLNRYAETQPYRDPNKLEQVTSMLQKAGLP